VTDPISTAKVSIQAMVLEGWAGELWACADVPNQVMVDVFDAAVPES
jgi:hypothetical protein